MDDEDKFRYEKEMISKESIDRLKALRARRYKEEKMYFSPGEDDESEHTVHSLRERIEELERKLVKSEKLRESEQQLRMKWSRTYNEERLRNVALRAENAELREDKR